MSATNASRQYLLSLHLLCFLSLISVIKSHELQLLLNVKSALQNSNTEVFNSWRSENSVCNFTGITCNSDGLVKEIELSSRELSGFLPLASICQLQSLEKLSLGGNFLTGTVPDDLKNCVRLQYLDLGNNFFTGSVPDISSMSQLRYLYLNLSGFSGAFPWKSLQNMTNLLSLSLGDNPFDQTPFPGEILQLYKLNWLYLSNCSIEGTIPTEIGNLTELINLEFSDNYLIGVIPPDIGKLKKLWQLELYYNSLTGKFPVGFGNLTSLENFDASGNFLEGNLSELRFLNNLVSLQLFENEFSGEVPAEFGEFKQLVNLSLYTNKLTGSLPQKLGSWANFNFLDVSENFLTGPIPLDMCKNGKMFALILRQNKFTGEIPVSYANCSSLKYFVVRSNMLSGKIPSICNLSFLKILDLSNNSLSGIIPDCSGNFSNNLLVLNLEKNNFHGTIPGKFAKGNSLRNLGLNGNQFEGPVPQSLCNCRKLEVLDLGNNHIHDTFPTWLDTLPELQVLVVHSNRFHGVIGDSKTRFPFPKLRVIDLSYNEFTGLLPTKYFKNLKAIMNMDEESTKLRYMGESYYYYMDITVTMKGFELKLVKILTIFTAIDLSNNKFQGQILKSIGSLNLLRVLNLSHNSFTGQIPASLGNLTLLESLDLSSNQLNGGIPLQLLALTFLEVLNLSHNHLVGLIPQGKQFATFENNSYIENSGLCGFPLSKKCGDDEATQPPGPPPSIEKEDNSEFYGGFGWKAVVMGYGSGTIFGLIMGFLIFLTGKPKWFVRLVEGGRHKKVKRSNKRAHSRRGRRN